jgi:hypothetical protein
LRAAIPKRLQIEYLQFLIFLRDIRRAVFILAMYLRAGESISTFRHAAQGCANHFRSWLARW